MRLFRPFLLAIIFLIWDPVSADFNIDDGIIFRVNFAKKNEELLNLKQPNEVESGGTETEKTDSENEEEEPRKPLDMSPPDPDSTPPETIVMTSSNNEKYTCTLPKVEVKSATSEMPYEGPNVLEILQQLFISQACAYRLEHYWTYELCHGRHVRQYHEEREGKDVKVTNKRTLIEPNPF